MTEQGTTTTTTTALEADATPAAATPETTPETPEAAEPTTDDTFDATRALEKIRKANAEAKALRERAKTAEDKAANLVDADKRATDLEAQLVRERVARKIGLPDELIDRLRGTTVDEVMADAESLVALVAPKQRPTASRPVESLQPGSGTTSTGPAQLTTLAGMSRDQINAAREAGQLDTMLGVTTA